MPLGIEDQAMVMIKRRRQAEQCVQHTMHAGRLIKVLPAHHMRHALQRVVHYDREMIAGRRILAREHDIAPLLRLGHQGFVILFRIGSGLDPGQRAGSFYRGMHVEPQRIGLACRDAARTVLRGKLFRSPGIER